MGPILLRVVSGNSSRYWDRRVFNWVMEALAGWNQTQWMLWLISPNSMKKKKVVFHYWWIPLVLTLFIFNFSNDYSKYLSAKLGDANY